MALDAPSNASVQVRRLTEADVDRVPELLAVFAAAFEDPEHYLSRVPDRNYSAERLTNPETIVLCAFAGEAIVGGAVCYVLNKIESSCPEFYLYDIAVLEQWRRRGVALSMISALADLAKEKSASCLYVQTENASDNVAPVALYSKIGTGQPVLHFDLALTPKA